MQGLIEFVQLAVEFGLFLLLLLDGGVGAHEVPVQLFQLVAQIDGLLGQLPVVLLEGFVGVVGLLLGALEARHFRLRRFRLGFGDVDFRQRLVQLDAPVSKERSGGKGGSERGYGSCVLIDFR